MGDVSNRIRRLDERCRPEPELDWIVAEFKTVDSQPRPKYSRGKSNGPNRATKVESIQQWAELLGIQIRVQGPWVYLLVDDEWLCKSRATAYMYLYAKVRRATAPS